MRTICLRLLRVAAGVALVLGLAPAQLPGPAAPVPPGPATAEATAPPPGPLPLSFIANAGQSAASIAFEVRGPGHGVGFGPGGVAFVAAAGSPPADPVRVDVRFPGSRSDVTPAGEARLPGVANFVLGPDPAAWQVGVPTYGAIRYRDLYPGIDVVYSGLTGALKSDWIVHPGADPAAIRVAYSGDVTDLRLDATGTLHVSTPASELTEAAPEVYQIVDGQRVDVPSRFRLLGPPDPAADPAAGWVGFEVGPYDHGLPLVIDPTLSYSTYLGGSADDDADAVALDAAGNTYIAGHTASTNFPTTAGAVRTTFAGGLRDAYVTKLNPGGTALLYSTYLGGSDDDQGFGIAADAAGNAYITGVTASQNFPTTAGAFQPTYRGGATDAFATKLGPTGALVYSSYLGGAGAEIGHGITFDTSGNAYITGETNSDDFPPPLVTAPAEGPRAIAGSAAFITKLNPAGSGMVYTSILGGQGNDRGYGIAVDDQGNAFVAGVTNNPQFPVTPGVVQPTFGGGVTGIIGGLHGDAFVARLGATGQALYSTYLGGSGDEFGYGIRIDGQGNAYVTGFTGSTNFPTTAGAFQRTLGGSVSTPPGLAGDAFVTKLNPTGTALVYSTYVGGSGDDFGFAIALDAQNNAYITGSTNSANFPVKDAFQSVLNAGLPTSPAGDPARAARGILACGTGGCTDSFVTELNPAGSALVYSSYLGGPEEDSGHGIAVDAQGSAVFAGATGGAFPTTAGAFQRTFGGGAGDGFVARVAAGTTPTPTPVVPELPPLLLFASGLLALGGLARANRRQR